MRRAESSGALGRFGGRIIICLILGAVLQYLVAAGFGLGNSYGEPDREWILGISDHGQTTRLLLSRHRAIGREVLVGEGWATHRGYGATWVSDGEPDWRRGEWLESQLAGELLKPPRNDLPRTPPSWSRFARITRDPTFDEYAPPRFGICIEVGCGWPIRSASYFAGEPIGGGSLVVREGIVVSKAAPAPGLLPRVIPLTVHWPGAIMNTLVYAAVLFVPFNLGQLMRARLRRRAGRCVVCGYDLRSNVSGVCPECGNG